MLKSLATCFLLICSVLSLGQQNMPNSGAFTSTSCAGTLYDNGGASGDYSTGPPAWFRIEPVGDSITLTFSSFSISGTGRLDIYDDSSFPRVLLHSFSGFVLPNGGNPITIPSGKVAVRFTSDVQSVAPGFAMNWSTYGNGGTTPTASFTTTSALIDWPVTFSDISTLAGYHWDFGDGMTSTDRNPIYTYTTPGVYTAQSVNTAGMPVGRYNYDVLLNTNGGGLNNLFTIPFVLDVYGGGSISLDKSCIRFDSLHTNVSYHDSIRVYNAGCDTLNINSISFSRAGITTDVSQLKLSPFDSAYIHVEVHPNSVGPQSDTIYLINNDTTVAVCVEGVGLVAPMMRIDSAEIHVVDTVRGCDDTVNFSFYLYNDGDTNLTWSVNSLPLLSDDFDASTSPSSIWQSTSLVDIGPNSCYIRSAPNAMEFIVSAGVATTIPFHTSGRDYVTFWAVPEGACGDQGFFDLYVEYTVDGGVTWNRIGTVSETAPLPAYYAFQIQASGLAQVRLSSQQHHVATGGYFVDDFAILGAQSAFAFLPTNGSISPSDSVLVSASIDIAGWSDGTYRLPFAIHSNDPSAPTVFDTVSLTLKLLREPILEIAQAGCLDFGTPPNGISQDSVLIKNVGCADLNLTGFLSTNSDFSAVADTNHIPPGDSTFIHITFNSRQVGVFNDTLTVFSNDTVRQICLNAIGVGAPNFSVTPDSIYVSAMGCHDSIIVPITISNSGGARILNFDIDSTLFSSGDSILNITVLETGAGPNYAYTQTLRAISEEFSGANIITSTATTSAALTTDLVNADVLVIPRQANLGVNDAQALSSAMKTFASRGGGVLVMASPSSVISAFDLFSHTDQGRIDWLTAFSFADTNHPVLSGVDLRSFALNVYWHHQLNVTSPNTHVVTAGFDTSAHLITITPLGGGNVAYFGYDFETYSQLEIDMQKAFGNTIGYLADIVPANWAYLSSYVDSVQVSDSSELHLVIKTAGLPDRIHSGRIRIHTNDPSNEYVTLPFFLEFEPDAGRTRLELGCIEFDSVRVASKSLDSTIVINTGCDTLHITSFSSATGDFSIESNLPLSIAPGDTAEVLIGFIPSMVGATIDTLFFQSTSDTSGLCVSGNGLNAPQGVNDDVQVFPNPSQGLFNVSSIHLNQLDWEGSSLELFSAHGDYLFTQAADGQQDVQVVDLSQLSPGMYILRIVTNSEQVSVRRLLLRN